MAKSKRRKFPKRRSTASKKETLAKLQEESSTESEYENVESSTEALSQKTNGEKSKSTESPRVARFPGGVSDMADDASSDSSAAKITRAVMPHIEKQDVDGPKGADIASKPSDFESPTRDFSRPELSDNKSAKTETHSAGVFAFGDLLSEARNLETPRSDSADASMPDVDKPRFDTADEKMSEVSSGNSSAWTPDGEVEASEVGMPEMQKSDIDSFDKKVPHNVALSTELSGADTPDAQLPDIPKPQSSYTTASNIEPPAVEGRNFDSSNFDAGEMKTPVAASRDMDLEAPGVEVPKSKMSGAELLDAESLGVDEPDLKARSFELPSRRNHDSTLSDASLRDLGSPDIEAPKPESPELERPKLETPKFDSPELETPKFKSSKFEASSIATPTFETPELETSKFETPDIETSDIETPKLESPELKTPDIGTPKFETRELETPDIETPKLESPELETPKFETPEFKTPDIETPKLETSKFEVPKVSALDPMSEMDLPDTSVSDIEAPATAAFEIKPHTVEAGNELSSLDRPDSKNTVSDVSYMKMPSVEDTSDDFVKSDIDKAKAPGIKTPDAKASDIKTPIIDARQADVPEAEFDKQKKPSIAGAPLASRASEPTPSPVNNGDGSRTLALLAVPVALFLLFGGLLAVGAFGGDDDEPSAAKSSTSGQTTTLRDAKTLANEPSDELAFADEETPTTSEAPVVEETPTTSEAPVVEETPTTSEAPVADETTVPDTAPTDTDSIAKAASAEDAFLVMTLKDYEFTANGSLPSDTGLSALTDGASQFYGSSGNVNVGVDPDLGAVPWADSSDLAAASMQSLIDGEMHFTSTEVFVRGTAASEESLDNIVGTLSPVLGFPPVNVEEVEITELSPPRVAVESDGQTVQIEGELPSQKILDSISATANELYGEENVTNSLVVNEGSYAGFGFVNFDDFIRAFQPFDTYTFGIENGEMYATLSDGLNFETGSAELTGETAQRLSGFVPLFERSGMIVTLEGHTDNVGSVESNLTLSQARAQSVADYFSGAGIDPSRLVAVGAGQADPIASNDTEEGRRINRRVELSSDWN